MWTHGERQVWIDVSVANKLSAMRGPGESLSTHIDRPWAAIHGVGIKGSRQLSPAQQALYGRECKDHAIGKSQRFAALPSHRPTLLPDGTDIAEIVFDSRRAAARNFGSWPDPIGTAVAHAGEISGQSSRRHLP